MANVTAAMVKELRESTGAGMMECKKALVEADGNLDAAADILRTRGLAAAAKKAGRATNEGRVVAKVCDTCGAAAVVEVNCETDFVAINDKFGEYCDKFAAAVIKNNPADVEALKESEFDGAKVADIVTDAIHVIGENIQIARFERVEIPANGGVVSYNHMNNKIGVLVSFECGNAATAATDAFQAMGKDVAMQIAATNPVSLDKDSVPAEVAEHEMSIYKAQAAESGKPEAIQEKIASGRMEKFYKENCLVAQDFVKDPDKTVEQYVASVAKKLGDTIKIAGYARIALGA